METFLLTGLFFLLGFIAKDYFPSYFRKKAENLATKEDIEAITEKIESVKANISLSTDQEKQYLGLKQSFLLAFYDEVTDFFYETLAANFGDFPMDEGQSMYDYQVSFYKSVANILKAYQRLVIVLPGDSKLLNFANQITIHTIGTRNVMKSKFHKIKLSHVKESQAHSGEDISEIKIAASEADIANKDFWGEMKPFVESIKKDYQSFLTELNSDLVIERDA